MLRGHAARGIADVEEPVMSDDTRRQVERETGNVWRAALVARGQSNALTIWEARRVLQDFIFGSILELRPGQMTRLRTVAKDAYRQSLRGDHRKPARDGEAKGEG